MTTNEASYGARRPWSAAASGGLVLPAPARKPSVLGSLGWTGAAPEPHAACVDGGTAITYLGKVVTCLVLVRFGRQRGIKTRVCDGHDLSGCDLSGLLCPRPSGVGLRPLRLPLFSTLMDLAAEAFEDTVQVCVCIGFMENATSSWTNSPTYEKSNEKVRNDFLSNLIRLEFCGQFLLEDSLLDQ